MKTVTQIAIKYLKEMMESCYAYETLSKDNSYIEPYKTKLGVELFNEVYDKHYKYVTETFTVNTKAYTDSKKGDKYRAFSIKIKNQKL